MSTLSKTITALPLALILITGAAAAQSQTSNGGGGGSSSNSGGEGANSGVAAQMDCLTGAYCPPNRRYPPVAYGDSTNCDQVRVRERIPGTNRYRVAYRCQWDRWGY